MSNICKVVILGENAVGKTCIVNRYISGTFRETVVSAGASFDSKTIFLKNMEGPLNSKFGIQEKNIVDIMFIKNYIKMLELVFLYMI